jgi:hypothetical protein
MDVPQKQFFRKELEMRSKKSGLIGLRRTIFNNRAKVRVQS